MKKYKINQLVVIFFTSLLCCGFVLKTKNIPNKKDNISLNNTIDISGTYKVLITFPYGTSKAERISRSQCVASEIGTYIVNRETCESNPEGEILTLAHRIELPGTTGGNELPVDGQEGLPPGVAPISLSNDDIMRITSNCEILIITDKYDCNDLSDFKNAF